MYAANVSKSLTGTHTNALGVSHGITKEVIHKAYLQKAFPDKNLQADEWTKRINQAKEVFSDQLQHTEYSDESNDQQDKFDPLESSKASGRQLSVVLTELFAVWLKESLSTKRRLFPDSLRNLLELFLSKQFKQWVKTQPPKPITTPTKFTTFTTKVTLYSQCLESASMMAREYSILATSEIHKVVCDQLELARTTPNKQCKSVVKTGELVPLVDFTKASLSQLDALSMLFLGDCNSSLSHNNRLAALTEFIPQVTAHSMKTKRNTCVMCSQKLPKSPPSPCIVLPRLGHMKPQKVCTSCCELTYQQDMNAWIEAGLGLFRSGGLAKIRPALGCFTLAVCSCQDSTEPMIKLVKEFLNLGIPGLGLSLISDLLKKPNDAKTAHLLACALLQSIAEFPNDDLFGQWQLLCTAKQACDSAHSAVCSEGSLDAEAPDLVTRKCDLDKALKLHLEKVKDKHNDLVIEMLDALEIAWSKRDWEQMLSMIKEKSFDSLAEVTNSQHFKEKMLEQFAASKKEVLPKLLPSDRSPILYFRGVLSIQKGQISSGMKDIEAAAWNSHDARWLQKEIIAVILTLLSKYRESILPTNALQITCNSLARIADISSSCSIFPSIEELVALPKMHWHDLGLSNKTLHSQFEQSVARQVSEGKQTKRKAALAYIDYCLACRHPAEKTVCFLTASLWFLRELRQTAAFIQHPELYALKTAVRWSLEQALALAHMFLHPGMCVYVSSIGLVVMLDAVKQADDLAMPEDSKLVAHLLEMFTYNCRFCPFWHAPIVTVSEAVLLYNLSGQLHSEFTLGLKNISELDLPVSKSELRYQIYENSICHLHSVEDPAEARRIAMFELLAEKGWSFQNVTDLMTFSPRTPDGWLIRQPTLGNKLAFAKIAGFVVKPESATIQLLVVPASEARVGLLSRTDVNSVLQHSNNELFPIYFSLDTPSQHQRFHPFQQIRHHPEKLGTNILNTMLEADYLLKSFMVDSEVSSVPPFHQRPCSDGLTADLPPKLRKILKPLSERGGRSGRRANHIWIQAEELTYSTVQTASGTAFILSDPVMAVHSKLQTKDKSSSDPISPDAQFAADVTTHYHEIKRHFPVLARLQELVKLQFFGMILNIAIENAKKLGSVADALVLALEKEQQRSLVGPVIAMLDNLLFQVRPRYPSEVIVSQVVNALMKETNYKLERRTMTSQVSYWLLSDYNRSKSTEAAQSRLASYLCSSSGPASKPQLKDMLFEKLNPSRPFLSKVEKLKEAANVSYTKTNCKLVPSAMNMKEDGSNFCYGGVIFAPKIKCGNVAMDQNAVPINLEPEITGEFQGSSVDSSKSQAVHGGNGDSTSTNVDLSLGWNRVFNKSQESKIDGNDYINFDDIVHVTREGTNQADPDADAETKSDQTQEIKFKFSPLHISLSANGGYIMSAVQAKPENNSISL